MKKVIILFSLIFCFIIFYKNDIKSYITFLYTKDQTEKIIDDFKNNLKPKNILNFIDVPKKNNNLPDDTIYNDVISRQTKPFGDEAGRHINVHETAHGIHSDLRNEYERKLGYKCNVFYCLKGRAVIIKDPSINISEVCKYIPKNLRSYRYDLYFKEQLKYWDDVPTYIFDEWTAYILGSECAVEDYELGVAHTKSDAVSGCLDFSIYSVAFAMAVKDKDPDYWNSHPEFKEFVKYNLKRAEITFYKGKDVFKSEKQVKLLDSFINNPDSKKLKEFMTEEFGEYFLKEVPITFIEKCGFGEVEEEFELDCEYEDVINLIENKKDNIIEEINIKVLEDLGDGKFKLRRKNNVGDFIWISKETINKNANSFTYKSNMLECIKGDIKNINLEISIEKIESKTMIKAKFLNEIDNISSKNLKMDMKMKVRRIKNFFKNELNLN